MEAGTVAAKRARGGFTLVEALISLVIFSIISFALALALSAAMRSYEVATNRQESAGAVRAVFGALQRDLQAAYASAGNTSALFVSGASGSSPGMSGQGTNSLLTLTTLSQRIQASGVFASDTGDSTQAMNTQAAASVTPQSVCALVRYDLNSQAGTLARTVSDVPNTQAIAQPDTSLSAILANNVVSLTLRFWDSNQQTWRTDWDFEQQNQPQSQSGTGTQANGQTGTQTNQNSQTGQSGTNSTGSGDTTLPTSVEVTLVVMGPDKKPVTHTTTIPIVTPQPQPQKTVAGGGA